jgi:hypothetical protein
MNMQLIVNAPHQNMVEKFVGWLCVELQISPRSLEVYAQDDLDGALGMCVDVSEDEFMILVKTKHRDLADYFVTIAHEMIHVKQYLKENLGHWMDTCSDTPYRQRWWEIEAFGLSAPLVEKFAKGLKIEA